MTYTRIVAEELADLLRAEHADNDMIRVSAVVADQGSDAAQFVSTDDDDTAGLYLVTVRRVDDSPYYRRAFPLLTEQEAIQAADDATLARRESSACDR